MADDETLSGEDRLIARHFAPLAKHPGAFGLRDDAAVLTPTADCDMVLKADAIIGGVHFFPDDPADTVARKALRVNLSDLAAKGAKPEGFLLSLGLPADISESWLAAFSRGLGEDAERFSCPLMGGDTVRSPEAIMVSVAVIGSVPRGRMVRRSGAKVGDRIFISGTIGDAALGLRLRQDPAAARRWKLDEAARAHLAARYLVPEPRAALSDAVLAHASAAMDVSDGLAGDLGKLCRASGVSADVDVARVPLSAGGKLALAAEPELIEPILTNGDDYEVLAAVPPANCPAFEAAARAAGVAVAEIGEVRASQAAPRFLRAGQPLEFARRSFSHF
jgi:thiamine-monophosphate kinase